ncbi:hypothetical protein LCGC14_3152490 [marine sediment metagenome]|uniref:Uncharacterized protein n=1 Tax=marine sediment metagenome TaxID=412755 RepID=A0A0F8Y0F6_9ZZZZ
MTNSLEIPEWQIKYNDQLSLWEEMKKNFLDHSNIATPVITMFRFICNYVKQRERKDIFSYIRTLFNDLLLFRDSPS